MANKEAPPPPPAGEEPPKKKGKLLIIIGAVVLLLVIAGGAAAFFLLKGGDHAEDEEEKVQEEKPKKKKKADPKHEQLPVFTPLDQFTVNLRSEGGGGENYLQVAISLEFEELADGERSKAFMPRIKNDMMLLLSGKTAADLNSKEGKEKLAQEIRDALNMILGKPEKNKKVPDGPVKDVLFTSCIIQ